LLTGLKTVQDAAMNTKHYKGYEVNVISATKHYENDEVND